MKTTNSETNKNSIQSEYEKMDLNTLTKKAENGIFSKGDPLAQVEMALRYVKGKDVTSSEHKAFDWYCKAAEQGHMEAQYQVGRFYYGIKEYEKAAIWFKRAADQGHSGAQFNLAVGCYNYGLGVEHDNTLALIYLQKSADQNHVEAQYNLGIFHELVLGSIKNAMQWYQKAAEQNHKEAAAAVERLKRPSRITRLLKRADDAESKQEENQEPKKEKKFSPEVQSIIATAEAVIGKKITLTSEQAKKIHENLYGYYPTIYKQFCSEKQAQQIEAQYEAWGNGKTASFDKIYYVNDYNSYSSALKLCERLKHSSSRITSAYLSQSIDDSDVEKLAAVLNNNYLTSLTLSGKEITAKGIKALAAALKNSHLTHLSLCGGAIRGESVEVLAVVLKDARLKYLSLWGCGGISKEGVKALAAELKNSSITKLKLGNNNLDDESVEILAAGLKESRVKHLGLSKNRNRISARGVKALMETHGSLASLDLSSNTIGEGGVKVLAAGLKNSRLTSLNLENCQIEVLIAGLKKRSLTELKLASCNTSVRILARAIVGIELQGRMIHIQGIDNALEAERDKCEKAFNNGKPIYIGRSNGNKNELDLSRERIFDETAETYLRPLALSDIQARLMQLPSNITHLNLSGLALNDQDVPALLTLLQKSCVTEIDVSKTNISKEAAMQLKIPTPHAKRLEEVRIAKEAKEKIRQEALIQYGNPQKSYFEALQNDKLSKLDLSHGKIFDKTAENFVRPLALKDIQTVLAQLPSRITELNLSGLALYDSDVNVLLELIEKSSVVDIDVRQTNISENGVLALIPTPHAKRLAEAKAIKEAKEKALQVALAAYGDPLKKYIDLLQANKISTLDLSKEKIFDGNALDFSRPLVLLADCKILLQVLFKNTSVQAVNFSFIRINDDAIATLIALLNGNLNIQELNISHTGISQKGIKALCTELRSRPARLQFIHHSSLLPIVTGASTLSEKTKEQVEQKAEERMEKQPLVQKREKQNDEIAASHLIAYSELTRDKKIGQGGFGIVYAGTWKYARGSVAIKELLASNLSEDTAEEFKNESVIMSQLHSDYLVRFYGCCLSPKYCLVMEYMPKGSLYAVLHSEEVLGWDIRYQIAMDIASGVNFLHKKNILHRDIKSQNILLSDNFHAKLTDFGLSKVKNAGASSSSKGVVGTVQWMAPELFEDEKCTAKSDMYSLGITFWELASRKKPFDFVDRPAVIPSRVLQGKRDEIPKDTPKKFASLIKFCWNGDAKERPSADQVVDYLRSKAEDFEQFISMQSDLSYPDNLDSMKNVF
jgi:hypothetical protein